MQGFWNFWDVGGIGCWDDWEPFTPLGRPLESKVDQDDMFCA